MLNNFNMSHLKRVEFLSHKDSLFQDQFKLAQCVPKTFFRNKQKYWHVKMFSWNVTENFKHSQSQASESAWRYFFITRYPWYNKYRQLLKTWY